MELNVHFNAYICPAVATVEQPIPEWSWTIVISGSGDDISGKEKTAEEARAMVEQEYVKYVARLASNTLIGG